jgi:predicted small secreted protein
MTRGNVSIFRDGVSKMTINETIRKLGILSVAALLAGITGCNTIEGVGEDVEAVGEEIEEEAEEF